MNTSEKPAPKPKRKGLRARLEEKCVTAACCAALGGCASTPPARPTPKPEECPPGAVETMTRTLGIDIGDNRLAGFPVVGNAKPVTVREFTTMRLYENMGKLPSGTVVSGRLIFGQDRLYGRFTQARTPGGETYRVCLELTGRAGERGAEMEPNGGPESAIVGSTQAVEAVRRFE